MKLFISIKQFITNAPGNLSTTQLKGMCGNLRNYTPENVLINVESACLTFAVMKLKFI